MTDAPPRHAPPPIRDVAIIGGGAAGVLAAIHLLKAGGGRLRVRLVEPAADPGEGIAYATRDAAHLLNVRAGNMSAFPDDPGDFVRHAEAHAASATGLSHAPLAQQYLPRTWYAGYLQATLARFAPPDGLHLRDRAVDIEGSGPFRIRLQSGATLEADAVVLATGNAPRPPVAPVAGLVRAWDHAAVAAIDPAADVAVVGSGLSMVDVAMTLAGNGHRGQIEVFSRHGLLPLAHHELGGPHGGDVDRLHPLGVRARLRALRADAAAHAAEGKPWQWVMDQLRPHGRALWQSLAPEAQARFLRHGVRHWDIHRHRIAPEVAARLDALARAGQLQVHAARVLGIEAHDGRIALRVRGRGHGDTATWRVDRLVDATGIETRVQALPGSLLAALVARGLARPGPHGLGIAVDAAGGVLPGDGHPAAAHLFAIGTPRLGCEWETTAIPDLRVQAAAIAQQLVAAAG